MVTPSYQRNSLCGEERMPRKKRGLSKNEQTHGHCADVLIADFGVPKKLRPQICDEIAKVWVQGSLIHCVIILSVRGFDPHGATRSLELFLEEHKTHPQKNRNPAVGAW